MDDEAALLAAILANPDEDTPRLVYADYLDENGHAARAEFIRVQIEVTRLPESERRTPKYRALLVRFRQLVAEYATDWSHALGIPSTRAIFRRGFIEEGTFSHAEVPTATNPALLREPLRVVKVMALDRGRAAAVAGVPVLLRLASWPVRGRFHTLQLADLEIPARAVGPFFASPALADLRVLDLSGSIVEPETVVALAECEHLTRLEDLRLGHVRLAPEQALALAQTANLPNLRTVELAVRCDAPDDDDAPDPLQPAISALQARYGRGVYSSRW